MTADYNGWADAREDERESQDSFWEDSDDLETDSVAPWRGEAASVHPPLEDVPGKTYPGQDETLEDEGRGHGDGEGEE